ncbi:MAG: PQQ-dependent sugar dehydrogenase [Chloroflexi bacterium]|nr:PQQ-dependent sugar dehydrogenase [Chloroflexota bacterium]
MLLVVFLLLTFGSALAQDTEPPTTRDTAPDPSQYQWVQIVSGFDRPLGLVNAGDGSARLFLMEQSGRVWIISAGLTNPEPFLNISDLLSPEVFSGRYSERGLLGLAFHPDYAENGLLFVHYSDRDGHTVIARYSVAADNPDAVDPASARIILRVQQPFPNHNGGTIAFGPDGYLYIGLGDGGSQADPRGNGQNPGALLGKILRIDVNADTYAIPEDNPYSSSSALAPEVWALGLRNPWRFSFDRATGDLYIADVGQNEWEEVNFQAADSPGGENYGWNVYEGDERFSSAADPANLVFPFVTYPHNMGCSVSGGYVYRGQALPDLQGVYLFGDWCSGIIWASYRDSSGLWQNNIFIDTQYNVSSFGEDENGELYLVDYGGRVLQLQAAS